MGSLPASSLNIAENQADRNSFYSRQTRLPGWGASGQAKLASANVLVVGVGGLGCPVLEFLARAGVGQLALVDDDQVELSNLGRQSLFVPRDVGLAKVTAAAARLHEINPWITVTTIAQRLDAANVLELIHERSLVIDGSDNFATKYLLHDYCHVAGIPLISASLYQWEAQLMVFPFHQNRVGCLRCLYPEAPVDGCVGTCAEVGVAGALAGLAGSAQALAALRLLLDLPGQAALTMVTWDASTSTSQTIRWEPDPTCACCSPYASLQAETNKTLVPTKQVDERTWQELTSLERATIIDIREDSELDPNDWREIMAAGSTVIHHPWSLWETRAPDFQPGKTYLISCAHGMRSRTAVINFAGTTTARLISLRGGYEAVRTKLPNAVIEKS